MGALRCISLVSMETMVVLAASNFFRGQAYHEAAHY